MSYVSAARHPWACFIFLAPILLVYEAGLLWLARDAGTEVARNGADVMVRQGLEWVGLPQALAAPAVVLGLLLVWSFVRWSDRPERPWLTAAGMCLESVVAAALLWVLLRQLPSWMAAHGVAMDATQVTVERRESIHRALLFLGAGIYEEVLFRLFLFGGLALLLQLMLFPKILAVPLAALGSALIFAAAHHVGPGGEAFVASRFVYRAAAGLFFALLYSLRGFGVAVGTHVAYDLVVGLRLDAAS